MKGIDAAKELVRIAKDLIKFEPILQYEMNKGIDAFVSIKCSKEETANPEINSALREIKSKLQKDVASVCQKERRQRAFGEVLKAGWTSAFSKAGDPRLFAKAHITVFKDANTIGDYNNVRNELERLGYKEM